MTVTDDISRKRGTKVPLFVIFRFKEHIYIGNFLTKKPHINILWKTV